ncbi:hypothetical protein CULT_1940009 [[Clostridium] ultunense Esp]|nr:hypothetical protein CULT_1940009 [[Clostridium] ultunense Esp]
MREKTWGITREVLENIGLGPDILIILLIIISQKLNNDNLTFATN